MKDEDESCNPNVGDMQEMRNPKTKTLNPKP